MKIKLRLGFTGTVHGYLAPKRGDILDIDDLNAIRYINLGYAEPVRAIGNPPVEKAVVPESEKAVVEVPASSIPPHPADDKVEEPKDKPKPLDDEPKPAPRPQGRPGQRR
jgi:hypothetical protein